MSIDLNDTPAIFFESCVRQPIKILHRYESLPNRYRILYIVDRHFCLDH